MRRSETCDDTCHRTSCRVVFPPPPNSNQVFSSPRSRRLGRIGGLVLGAVGTLVVLGGIQAVRDQGESWGTVVLLTWPVIFGVAEFLRAGSIAVVVTNDGILVRNEFRQRRIAWDEATRLIWRPQSMLVSTGYIARKKGRPIRSAAFRTLSESPGPEYLAFAEEFHHRKA